MAKRKVIPVVQSVRQCPNLIGGHVGTYRDNHFGTKNSNTETQTITAEKDDISFALINETEHVGDYIVICRDYTDEMELLAEYIIYDRELIDMELSENAPISIYKLELRKNGEKYGKCLKRIYQENSVPCTVAIGTIYNLPILLLFARIKFIFV